MLGLFKSKQKQWNIAYYQSPLQSPFKFEYDLGNEEGIINPFEMADIRSQTVTIFTIAKIEFRENDKIYINNHQYLVKQVNPRDIPELLNSPYFTSKQVGKQLVLRY